MNVAEPKKPKTLYNSDYRRRSPTYRRIATFRPPKGTAKLGTNGLLVRGQPPYELRVSKEDWMMLNSVLDFSGLTDIQASCYRYLVWFQMKFDFQPSYEQVRVDFGRQFKNALDALLRTRKLINYGMGAGWMFPGIRWIPVRQTGEKSPPTIHRKPIYPKTPKKGRPRKDG